MMRVCTHPRVPMPTGALAGAVGGINVTLTKAIFAMLVDAASRGGLKKVFSTYLIYVVAVCVVATYLLEIRLTVHGLEQVGAMIFLPTFAVVEQLVIAMGAMLVFQDYALFTSLGASMFAIGNFLALSAVLGMSYARLRAYGKREASALLPPAGEASKPSDASCLACCIP